MCMELLWNNIINMYIGPNRNTYNYILLAYIYVYIFRNIKLEVVVGGVHYRRVDAVVVVEEKVVKARPSPSSPPLNTLLPFSP